GIPYDRCGKIVVATAVEELPRLEELFRRGTANGVVGLEMIGPERVREIEPHATGVKALYVPPTRIIDFPRVSLTSPQLVQEQGGEIKTGHRVQRIVQADGGLVLETSQGAVQSKFLINCGGLFSDRLARMAGANPDLQIVPFRGEYYTIAPQRRGLVNKPFLPPTAPAVAVFCVPFSPHNFWLVYARPNSLLAFARAGD